MMNNSQIIALDLVTKQERQQIFQIALLKTTLVRELAWADRSLPRPHLVLDLTTLSSMRGRTLTRLSSLFPDDAWVLHADLERQLLELALRHAAPFCVQCGCAAERKTLVQSVQEFKLASGTLLLCIPISQMPRQLSWDDLSEMFGAQRILVDGKVVQLSAADRAEEGLLIVGSCDAKGDLRELNSLMQRYGAYQLVLAALPSGAEKVSAEIPVATDFSCPKCKKKFPALNWSALVSSREWGAEFDVELAGLRISRLAESTPPALCAALKSVPDSGEALNNLAILCECGLGELPLGQSVASLGPAQLFRLALAKVAVHQVCDIILVVEHLFELLAVEQAQRLFAVLKARARAAKITPVVFDLTGALLSIADTVIGEQGIEAASSLQLPCISSELGVEAVLKQHSELYQGGEPVVFELLGEDSDAGRRWNGALHLRRNGGRRSIDAQRSIVGETLASYTGLARALANLFASTRAARTLGISAPDFLKRSDLPPIEYRGRTFQALMAGTAAQLATVIGDQLSITERVAVLTELALDELSLASPLPQLAPQQLQRLRLAKFVISAALGSASKLRTPRTLLLEHPGFGLCGENRGLVLRLLKKISVDGHKITIKANNLNML